MSTRPSSRGAASWKNSTAISARFNKFISTIHGRRREDKIVKRRRQNREVSSENTRVLRGEYLRVTIYGSGWVPTDRPGSAPEIAVLCIPVLNECVWHHTQVCSPVTGSDGRSVVGNLP